MTPLTKIFCLEKALLDQTLKMKDHCSLYVRTVSNFVEILVGIV